MNESITMYVRPQDQGQIVEVSYGYGHTNDNYIGLAYAWKRELDRSDGSVTWWRGEIDWDREPEHLDPEHIPCVLGWIEQGSE